MLNAWAISLILWSFYRWHFKTDLPIWLDEFIMKPALFFGPIFYYIRKVEGKNILTALGFRKEHWKTDILLGIFIGLAVIISAVISNYMKWGQVFSPAPVYYGTISIGMILAISFASAFSEELVSRGFVLKRLHENTGQYIRPVLYSSLLYIFLRVPMLFVSEILNGYAILQILATDFIVSLIIGSLFLMRKSIMIAIIVHMMYNISLYLFL